MLTERSRNKALEDFLKGRKVIVITVFNDGSIAADKLEDILMTEDVHYLADVPTVENPEFAQAVADMVQAGQKEPSEEKNSTPPPTRPEVNEVLPAGKTTKEIIFDLAAQGMTAPEIARKTGIKYNTVYFHLNPEKCSKRKKSANPAMKERAVGKPGWNKDRHACKSCRYRAGGASSGCDYYVITDMERGCDPADCDRYIEGERVERKKK